MINDPAMAEFNPNSQDAMFATIMSDVRSIKDTVLAIKADQAEHRQVTQGLVAWREKINVKVAVIAATVATGGSVGYNAILDVLKS
jgi:hypothetical protein